MKALARDLPAVQYASKLEAAWAQQLALLQRAGEVRAWVYEGVTLRLADGARYTPDFLVITSRGEIELHEVKGHMREAANVRLKVAAALFPWFRLVLVRRGAGARGQWTCDEVTT